MTLYRIVEREAESVFSMSEVLVASDLTANPILINFKPKQFYAI